MSSRLPIGVATRYSGPGMILSIVGQTPPPTAHAPTSTENCTLARERTRRLGVARRRSAATVRPRHRISRPLLGSDHSALPRSPLSGDRRAWTRPERQTRAALSVALFRARSGVDGVAI